MTMKVRKRMDKITAMCIIVMGIIGTTAAQTWDCGETTGAVTCVLDNGTLTISGMGAMKDYTWDGSPCYTIRDSIITVVIEDGVTSIGSSAFSGCSSLTSIAIPNSVTSIGSSAFRSCSSLTSVTIPNSVTEIGWGAFQRCTGLTSVTIPNSVTEIVNQVFEDCTSLTYVTIPNVTIVGNAFRNCPIKNITITGTGKMVDNFILSMDDNYSNGIRVRDSLTTVVIGDSITSIGNNAFYYCRSLTSITIPNSVTSIGNNAFDYCRSLTSITIPNSVTSIGRGAFYNCYGLTSLTIPNMTSYSYAFINCPIKTLTITGTGNMADTLIRSMGGGSSGNRVSDSLTTVVIEEGITSIGDYAFSYCPRLTSITIPNSVTSIGDGAFERCIGLTSITIPDGVTEIGKISGSGFGNSGVFYHCTNLTSITIPNSVTTIGNAAFQCCSSLTSIEIPNSVTSIGNYAFRQCTGLTSITIPDNVTTIGDYTFYQCTGLTSIMIPNSVTEIGSSAFQSCSRLTSVTIPNITFPTGAAFTGAAFRDCPIKTLTITGTGNMADNFITSIGNNYSYDISIRDSLTTVVIEEGITSIGQSAFSYCRNLTSITIPNSVTEIGSSAFSQCSSLTSITIPDGVTSIGNGAFNDCSGLTSITIPNSVTSIGGGAFSWCTGLTSITIPNSVTSIGNNAFWYCTGLTSVISLKPIPPAYTFHGIDTSSACLYVPPSSIYIYKTAPGWGSFKCIEAADDSLFVSVLTSDRVIPPEPDVVKEAAVIKPAEYLSSEFAAGPNIVSKKSGAAVKIYRQGKRIDNGVLTVYNMLGNVVNKVSLSDYSGINSSKRIVGSWDLRDMRGRIVVGGTYLIRGTVIVDGKREKVSLAVSVR